MALHALKGNFLAKSLRMLIKYFFQKNNNLKKCWLLINPLLSAVSSTEFIDKESVN